MLTGAGPSWSRRMKVPSEPLLEPGAGQAFGQVRVRGGQGGQTEADMGIHIEEKR